jgi:DNA polymerase-3 subunit epsilon
MGFMDFVRKAQEQALKQQTQALERQAKHGKGKNSDNDSAMKRLSLVFLDTETPNMRNDRICSIGLVRTDFSGNIIDREYRLVDPESHFDNMNMEIHGISPRMVDGAGNFLDVWNAYIARFFDGSPLIAHNAGFDLAVLDKAMTAYGIPTCRTRYADTYDIARTALPGLGNHNLDTICSALGVHLEHHHNAMDDAMACEESFFSMIEDPSHIGWKVYTPISLREAEKQAKEKHYKPKTGAQTKPKASMVDDIRRTLDDGRITIEEAKELFQSIKSESDLAEDDMFKAILEELRDAIEDGEISPEEEDRLIRVFEKATDPTTGTHEVEFDGRVFCLTGDFIFGSKAQVASAIEARGGSIANGVSKKVDYVVIGGQGSDKYAFGNYGTKVKKALDMKSNGIEIHVIAEDELCL